VAWSSRVSQSVEQHGSRLVVTVRPDAGWLADPKRVFPVVVDPTIRVEPTPTQSQDVMILAEDPSSNFDGSIRLSVGTTSNGAARTLVKFPLPPSSELPAGTPLDSADLMMYYDQTFTSDSHDVPIEAHRATSAWDASTATWNNASSNVGELGVNQVTVDDGDSGTSQVGSWPYSTNTTLTALAVNGDYAFNQGVSGNTASYTWTPRLTEDGTYRVEAHYVTASDRSTAAPYTITRSGGTSNVTLDQTAGGTNVGVWGSLGSYSFTAGTTGKVVLHGVTDSTKVVLADAVRWTKDGIAHKTVNQQSVWHTFPVRNIVQSWVNGTTANNGFVLKTTNEGSLGQGGPRYEASEFAYNGETANRPKLVLTWGRPSVQLAPVTVAHATGAELHWPAYVDPSPSPDDDAVEYQVHRSVFQTFVPSASTLVAPLPTGTLSYTDTTATPTPADSPDPFGNAYYYMIAVKTRDGQVIPGPTQVVRLPKAGQVFATFPVTADTTISSGEPTTAHDMLDGQFQDGVGDTGSFAKIRTLAKFSLSGIPAGATITSAQVRLWAFFMSGGGTATYNLHGLTRDFDETATWNNATSTTAWTTAGGDFSTTVSDGVTGITNDPAWQSWDVTTLARSWFATPSSNHGVLIKLANETSPLEQTLFLSGEAPEPQLRPQLQVTYTEPTAENTYYAPSTPERMLPGDQQTVAVTLTNTTGSTWSAADHALSYHWALPDGTDVTTGGNQVQTPLPADVPPGGVVTVNAALKSPIQSAAGNKREAYVLTWDLLDTSTGQFLSTSDGIPGLAQNVAVEDPTSDQLGLEKFYQYAGLPTGSGTSLMDNLFAGNLVWGYNPFSNPSRGVSTFVRLTYNSQDTSASSMGSAGPCPRPAS
jgi:TGF-beta propeptide